MKQVHKCSVCGIVGMSTDKEWKAHLKSSAHKSKQKETQYDTQ